MVAYYCHKWQSGRLEHVATPYVFFRQPEICLVSAVYYEVYVAACLYCIKCFPGIVVRALRVGDKGELKRDIRHLAAYGLYAFGIHLCGAAYLACIWVVLKPVA